MTRTQKLLRELIALPSVNPAMLPPGHRDAGEHQVGEFLASVLADAGLDIEFQEVLPGRSNLLARLGPKGKARQRIVLAPHMDTVSVADNSQFSPTLKGGRLYGRGACDTKGSVAAMVLAIVQLAASGARPESTEIFFAGLVDEEAAQTGSRVLAKSGFKADLAIVGEPTRLQLVTAHKGDFWIKLETRGKAAHGARPELGRNAVHEMAQIVHLLETEYAKQLRRKKHSLLRHPTVNVGVISGGVQANIVPDQCSIMIDRRTIPGETQTKVWREINALLRRHGLKASLSSQRTAPCEPLETNPKLPLVRQFLDIVKQPKPAGVDYFCDASPLAQGGIPSVVFGPGDIAQAHTADEWISLESLERGNAILVEFLKSLP